MSEHEPTYLVLDWDEDFKLDAHVDADGQQRFAVTGYIQKRRADGLYRAPLIPELFFGVDGSQLQTWSQNLTAGDHTILRRDSGNPYVPDDELSWQRVSSPAPSRPPMPTPTRVVSAPLALDMTTVLILVLGIPIGLYLLYKAVK